MNNHYDFDDVRLSAIEGKDVNSWRSNCSICGKEFEHKGNPEPVRVCSPECREKRKERIEQARQSKEDRLLLSWKDLPVEQQIERLKEKFGVRWKSRQRRLEHLISQGAESTQSVDGTDPDLADKLARLSELCSRSH